MIEPTKLSWTQPICDDCWDEAYPNREPVVVVEPEEETCALCGWLTSSGIYIRRDPKTVEFPRWEEE